MAVTVKQLRSKDETGQEMRRLATQYAGDLACFQAGGIPLDRVPLSVFFRAIADLPYRRDPGGVEIVSRPYLLLQSPTNGLDCKKKATILGAYLERNRIPWRYAAVSRWPAPGPLRRPPIHHVIVQAWIDGEWVDIDATYPGAQLFEAHQWTRVEPLSGNEPATDAPVLVSMSGDGDPTWDLYCDYYNQVQDVSPEFMGEGITAAGVTIIAAIIAAVATITVSIISAASSKRDREHADKVQAQTISSYAALQTTATTAAATAAAAELAAAEAQQIKMEKTIKQYVIPGSLALAAIFFLGGNK